MLKMKLPLAVIISMIAITACGSNSPSSVDVLVTIHISDQATYDNGCVGVGKYAVLQNKMPVVLSADDGYSDTGYIDFGPNSNGTSNQSWGSMVAPNCEFYAFITGAEADLNSYQIDLGKFGVFKQNRSQLENSADSSGEWNWKININ